jgi:hypothetical protein
VLDVEQEGLHFGETFYAHRRSHTLLRDRGDQRDIFIPVLGRLAEDHLIFGILLEVPALHWSSTSQLRRRLLGSTRSGSFAKHLALVRLARLVEVKDTLTLRRSTTAVVLECHLVGPFEVLPQRLLLLRGGEDEPLTSCGGFGIGVLALTAALDLALDGRGDAAF